jgi:hypothetical protein
MTIVETLEDVNDNLSVATRFIYVNSLNEANYLVDALTDGEFPVCLMLPVIVRDTPGKSGILKSKFQLGAYFLNKISGTTNDFKTNEVESTVIKPMRDLAREYVHKLNETDLIDPETDGIGERTFEPEYDLMDASLFGVFVKADVPVMEGVTGCV